MNLLLTGISYKTAPVGIRERLAVPEAALSDALSALLACNGPDEVLLLSTCNRVEILAHAPDDVPLTADALLNAIARLRSLDPAALRPHFYTFTGRDALRHLFRVASSLDSMVLGEPQILGQLKEAYSAARRHGAVQHALDTILTRAFAVAKRVRSETSIGRNAVSVSYAAIELARQIFGDLRSKNVLLIGAGKMSELAARHLRRAGCQRILVTNRTRSRAEEMAALVQGSVIEYDAFHDRLPEIDIVLASSGAPEYLIGRDEMKLVLRRRQNRPIFLIDIAVPRNIDPAVDELENAYLYDIDGLGREVEANRRARQVEAGDAEQIVDEEIDRLFDRIRAREAAPLIVSLQKQFDELASAEFERFRSRLGPLTPEHEEQLHLFARSLLNKVAHGPMTEIRRAASLPEGDRILSVIRRMFRLEDS